MCVCVCFTCMYSAFATTPGFREQGVLTPEEFVAAGDFLVRTCPTWSWAGGAPAKRRPFLPADKQFLVTKNVPCLRRVDALPADGGMGAAGVGKDDEEELEDDWIAPRGQASDGAEEVAGDIGEEGDDNLVASSSSAGGAPGGGATEQPSNDDDDDVPDMDDFDDDNIVEDVAALTVGASTATAAASSSSGAGTSTPNQGGSGADTTNVLKTRTYDLSITYDKYYQTPRMWLIGYDEQNKKLEPVRCLEDVSHEHARKTVTIDEHPCLDVMAASIHPCKHANVMKRITDMMEEGGKTPVVEHYLFLFLKFIASIVPTIQYDFTMSVSM